MAVMVDSILAFYAINSLSSVNKQELKEIC